MQSLYFNRMWQDTIVNIMQVIQKEIRDLEIDYDHMINQLRSTDNEKALKEQMSRTYSQIHLKT